MDPCHLLANLSRPAVWQLNQGDNPFLSFLKGGALTDTDSGLAILDMDAQELTSTWKCPDAGSCIDCKAGPDSGPICVVASASSNYRRQPSRTVDVLEPSSLQELLLIEPPFRPCRGAMAASRPLAAVQCNWVQPSPDGRHNGLWWCDTADRSCSRLCIYSLLGTELVAYIDCQAVFGAPVFA